MASTEHGLGVQFQSPGLPRPWMNTKVDTRLHFQSSRQEQHQPSSHMIATVLTTLVCVGQAAKGVVAADCNTGQTERGLRAMQQTAAPAHRPVCTVRAAGAAALADRDLDPVLGVLGQVRPQRGGLVQVLRHVGGVGAARPRWDLPRRHDDLPCSHEADAVCSLADQVA